MGFLNSNRPYSFIRFLRERYSDSRARAFKKKNNLISKKVSIKKEFALFFALLGVTGLFAYFLTDAAVNLAHSLGIPPVIVAFTIIAAATSLPDLIISVANARNGDIDDATSNVFGSNVFDILIGIGLPLFIYNLFKGAIEITFSNLEIILGLLGSTILVLYFFADNRTLNKRQAKILLFMYVIFVAYTVYLAT